MDSSRHKRVLVLISSLENYYATIYSAEIVNTLTNLLFIYLGIKGIRNCLKYDHDSVFLVAFIGCKVIMSGYGFIILIVLDLLVGTGSFAFHSTLKCKEALPRSIESLTEVRRSYAARG